MTKDELVRAIAKDVQKRATIKDGITVRIAYLREAEAILESIESAGWTVVPHEAAQTLTDSTLVDSPTGPSVQSAEQRPGYGR
jgi:hypothetical protein